MWAAWAIERSAWNVKCGTVRRRSRGTSQFRMKPRALSRAWSDACHSVSEPSTLT